MHVCAAAVAVSAVRYKCECKRIYSHIFALSHFSFAQVLDIAFKLGNLLSLSPSFLSLSKSFIHSILIRIALPPTYVPPHFPKYHTTLNSSSSKTCIQNDITKILSQIFDTFTFPIFAMSIIHSTSV